MFQKISKNLVALSLLSAQPISAQQYPTIAPSGIPKTQALLPARPLWSTKRPKIFVPFQIAEDALIIRDEEKVKRLNISDGSEVWALVTKYEPIKIENNLLFLINNKFELLCLDARNGSQQWKIQLTKEGEGIFGLDGNFYFPYEENRPLISEDKFLANNSAGVVFVRQNGLKGPIVSGNKVLVGTFGGSMVKGRSGKLYAFDLKDGKLIWSFEAEDGLEHPPLIYGGKAIFGGVAACYSVDLETGKQVWKTTTRNDNQLFFKIVADTLLVSSGHYGAPKSAFLGTLYAIDLNTGNQRWTYDIGGPSVLRVSDGKIVGIEWGMMGGTRLTCLNLNTGQKLWEYKEKGTSWPVIQEGKVIYLSKDNKIHIVDLETGKAAASLPASGDFQMGLLNGPWGRFMDAQILQGQVVVGSWDKKKKESILQVLDPKQAKSVEEKRIPGELWGIWEQKDFLLTLVKTEGGDVTFQVWGR